MIIVKRYVYLMLSHRHYKGTDARPVQFMPGFPWGLLD
jgi:hypothetical protein